MHTPNEPIADTSLARFIADAAFPCVAAKTALAKGQVTVMKAHDLRCPADDSAVLAGLYAFVDGYNQRESLFQSLVVIFRGPKELDEAGFESALWSRLQALHDLDAPAFGWDSAASADPDDQKFSLSIAGRAFYVVGLHPRSSRSARQFSQPAIVFNLHDQFERLRERGAYVKMQAVIRQRDLTVNGSVNPMLADFGQHSEARQYSGREVDASWRCPFQTRV